MNLYFTAVNGKTVFLPIIIHLQIIYSFDEPGDKSWVIAMAAVINHNDTDLFSTPNIRYKIRNMIHLNCLENHNKMKYYCTKSGQVFLYNNHFSFQFINFCAFFLICLSIHFHKSYFTNFFHYYSLIFRTFSYCYLCNIPI